MELDFTPSGAMGQANAWSWNRIVAFRFAGFGGPGGVQSRIETFEGGWHSPSLDPTADNGTFVSSLVVPTTARAAQFGSLIVNEAPTAFESFERHWRLPATPPADGAHAGNETAIFAWGPAASLEFANGTNYEDFESGWRSDEAYVRAFTSAMLRAALFESAPAEAFAGWVPGYVFAFTAPELSAAQFHESAVTKAAEDFSAVVPDRAVTFAPPSTIDLVGAAGFPANCPVTFYNAGGAGNLPAEIDSRRSYFVVSQSGSSFEIAAAVGGAPIVFSAASGNNYVKTDPTAFWTLTDVGL